MQDLKKNLLVMYMGNYFSTEIDNDVYTLQDEEEERKIIDNYMDNENNNKNFWYWGFIHDLILDPE